MASRQTGCRRVAMAIVLTTSLAGSATVWAQGAGPAGLSARLDGLAAQLSQYLSDQAARTAVLGRVRATKEGVVPMRDALGAALAQKSGRDAAAVHQLLAAVQRLEAELARAGAPVPRLDLKLPVPSHGEQLGTASTINVIAAPLADESEVQTVTAFVGAKRFVLDPAKPLPEPTLVIVPAESQLLEPSYPLSTSTDSTEEEHPRRVDDFVGVVKILIRDDHENAVSGKPEIYVQIFRSQGSSGTITSHDLKSVNDENVWYHLGDPNSTYEYYDLSVDPLTTIAVWEEDNFAHGADDFLGSVTFDWTALTYSGYTTFRNGDMEIQVDRD